LEAFSEVLRGCTKDVGVHTSKALVLMEMGESWLAVAELHKALAVSPQDPMATDLLNRALADTEITRKIENEYVEEVGDDEKGDEEIDEMDRKLHGRLREIEQNRVAGRRGGRRRRHAQGMAAEDMSQLEESMVVDSDD
jgi:anaphase-promoting complex subunit 6